MTFIPEKNYKLSFFNEQTNVNKKVLFVSEPVAGAIVSPFRDRVEVTGDAFVSGGQGEFALGTGPAPNSVANFTTRRRAQYIAGYEMEVGAGVRIPVPPTGTQCAEWGYFDDANGLGYGVDATGSFVFVRDGAEDIKVYQSDWNVDTLDGSGSTGITLDLSLGVICQANFTWYGYGDIEYSFYIPDPGSNRRRKFVAHRQVTSGGVSLETPNQPVRIEIENGADGGEFNIFVGGRQVSVFGESGFSARLFSTFITGANVPTGPDFTPLITVRKKNFFGNSTGQGNTVQAVFNKAELISNQDIIFDVIYSLSGSLSSEGFSSIADIPPNETAVEALITGSNPTGADLIYRVDTGFIAAASSRGSTSPGAGSAQRQIYLDDDSFITLRAKAISATATVNAIFEWQEDW